MIASSWVPQTTGGSLKRYRFAVCFVAAFSCVNLFSSCSWIIGIQFDINENFENPTSSNLTTFASKLSTENRRYAYIGKNESDRVSMEQRNASALQSQRKNREIEFIGKTSEIKLARESGENVWDSAILATTKILYRNSHSDVLQFWLSQPPPKVYIYPTIPSNFSDVETISHCIDQKFLGPNVSEIWVQKKKNCRWRPEICQDHTTPAKPKHQMFLAYRYNYNIDVAYLDKFHRYPHQTSDPSDADLFVVPYPHKSHCLCNKNFRHYSARCAVSFDEIQSNVLSNLEFMQEPAKSSIPYSPERHVFFHGADWLQELKHFRAATSNSISISLGPVSPCEHSEEKPCGHVTVPYLSTDRDFQPHVFFERVWSSSSKRPYFLAAALSSPRGLPLRGEFLKHWKKWIGKSINNKPHQIINMGISRGGKKPMSREFIELYRNSTVCLILPGDGCAQKRFFDALLEGCIPLVPLFPSNEKSSPFSFHHANGCSSRITYPSAKGTFFHDSFAGFDVLDMVFTFNGTCGLPCLNRTLIELVSNNTVIDEKQKKLREYASVVLFGLTDDSNGHPDAFSSLIVRLRHHVWHILDRTPVSVTNLSDNRVKSRY